MKGSSAVASAIGLGGPTGEEVVEAKDSINVKAHKCDTKLMISIAKPHQNPSFSKMNKPSYCEQVQI